MRKCKSRALQAAVAAALMLNGGSAVIADTVVTHTGPLKWETNEGEFKLQVGGRIMADAAFYDEDNVDLDGESGTEFRRARLFVAGTMFHDWDWKAQYDFAGNEAEIKDAYIRYTGFEPAKFTIGQFKQPFSLEELVARVEAVLRRTAPAELEEARILGYSDLEMDEKAHRVSRAGRPLDLAPTEFNLLQFFMSHPERAYTRSQLLDQVWGANVYVEERTVDVHIRRLRMALEPAGLDGLIQTVRGSGYRFSTHD